MKEDNVVVGPNAPAGRARSVAGSDDEEAADGIHVVGSRQLSADAPHLRAPVKVEEEGFRFYDRDFEAVPRRNKEVIIIDDDAGGSGTDGDVEMADGAELGTSPESRDFESDSCTLSGDDDERCIDADHEMTDANQDGEPVVAGLGDLRFQEPALDRRSRVEEYIDLTEMEE